MTMTTTTVDLEAFQRDGFLKFESFADPAVCKEMLDRVVTIARQAADRDYDGPAWVLPESNLKGREGNPEDLVSKIFRLHRDTVFNEFALDERVLDIVAEVLDRPELDCFLSQFIFKNPGAWGQPWHQDSYYFHFEPRRPIVGVWLAVTEATLENGCLHVLPGSHNEPLHEHVPDRRPDANLGYTEIIDHDMSASQPVLMNPGDLLVFDSHLMHRSTDNVSDGIRAAMVYHYCGAGTVDTAKHPINDFMPARRP